MSAISPLNTFLQDPWDFSLPGNTLFFLLHGASLATNVHASPHKYFCTLFPKEPFHVKLKMTPSNVETSLLLFVCWRKIKYSAWLSDCSASSWTFLLSLSCTTILIPPGYDTTPRHPFPCAWFGIHWPPLTQQVFDESYHEMGSSVLGRGDSESSSRKLQRKTKQYSILCSVVRKGKIRRLDNR